ncbi:pantoate--beta-alanine ligase [Algoriphagus machipongonensis]|uniref:Pantothenate synthetase n=1 Tax=Algoriphagus machipongonensis TaxID=388413 RepID=A3HVC9_9BACT|nr:pantoate--beta-alanine ligase [Algoriphagus machipongonensis]EAZ82101.1 pantoate--beta-alanine ligase [Algoriphagus machipongonensis]
MQVLKTGAEWQKIWLQSLQSQKIIGFVPTMGALHEGHLDLIRNSKKSNDITVVSIFVNPIQFNNQEDFDNYPSLIKEDLALLEKENVDVVYLPDPQSMYPEKPVLSMHFGDLESVLEGAFRPGHFSGVGIIVSKLFNIIRPHQAFFGQKDLQQVAVIKRMVKDLSFQTEIITVPTRREEDGLALSSRNLRLSKEERDASLILIESLNLAKNELLAGKDWLAVRNQIQQKFEDEPLANLEYFELINPDNFQVIESIAQSKASSICVASYIGNIRLIDNLPIIP